MNITDLIDNLMATDNDSILIQYARGKNKLKGFRLLIAKIIYKLNGK